MSVRTFLDSNELLLQAFLLLFLKDWLLYNLNTAHARNPRLRAVRVDRSPQVLGGILVPFEAIQPLLDIFGFFPSFD